MPIVVNCGRYNIRAMKTRFLVLMLLSLLLTACAGNLADSDPVLELTPYRPFITPTVQTIPVNASTPLPAPTPTPVVHVVVAGDTVSGIALKYGVEIAAVLAANPQIDPRAMSVGTQLLIPSSSTSAISSNSSIPESLTVGTLNCLPSGSGIWCFLPILNDLDYPVENITVRIIVGNSQTGELADQISTPPLNILYPDATIALAAYFNIPLTEPLQSSFELLSAQAVHDGQSRYLETALQNIQTSIDPSGLSAVINGEISLVDASSKASHIWMAAVAYDAQWMVVGVRRWENSSLLNGGQWLPFSFQVYSAGGSISKVDMLVEARK